jgi:hypothetical protein
MPAMDESIRWGSRRCLTLLLVILAHAGLLAWLVSSLRATRAAAEPSVESVQLVFLPPRMMPRIRVEAPQPLHVRTGTPAAPPPLPLDAASSLAPQAPAGSGSTNGGAGVDWAAEARRALQAFEIRSHQPASGNLVSRRSPAEQPWWPAHRPGDRYKTADGNWIVWIDSSCYQVATSAPSTNGSAPQPRTVCPGPGDSPPPESAGSTP